MTDETGARVKHAIKGAGLTQKQVAEAIGVTPQSVNKWIKEGKISRDHLMDLSRATGSTFTWLATGEGAQLHQVAETFFRNMAESGVIHAQVMDDLGIAPKTLIQWVAEASPDEMPEVIDQLVDALHASPEFVRRVLLQTAREKAARAKAQLGGVESGWHTTISGALHLSDSHWHELVETQSGLVDVRTSDPTAYALVVKGDQLAPAVCNGWMILIEPGKEPQPGEYGLIRNQDGKFMVCELLYQRRDEISVSSITRFQDRISITTETIDYIRQIGAILPPSNRARE
jgi:plasmid maintenance system antidote protein VapI